MGYYPTTFQSITKNILVNKRVVFTYMTRKHIKYAKGVSFSCGSSFAGRDNSKTDLE